ncbi:MAG: hypothetical protein ACK5KU_03485 [Beutenbergiaceae bacterium]
MDASFGWTTSPGPSDAPPPVPTTPLTSTPVEIVIVATRHPRSNGSEDVSISQEFICADGTRAIVNNDRGYSSSSNFMADADGVRPTPQQHGTPVAQIKDTVTQWWKFGVIDDLLGMFNASMWGMMTPSEPKSRAF